MNCSCCNQEVTIDHWDDWRGLCIECAAVLDALDRAESESPTGILTNRYQ